MFIETMPVVAELALSPSDAADADADAADAPDAEALPPLPLDLEERLLSLFLGALLVPDWRWEPGLSASS